MLFQEVFKHLPQRIKVLLWKTSRNDENVGQIHVKCQKNSKGVYGRQAEEMRM